MLPTNISDSSEENSSTKVEEMLKDIKNSPNDDSKESQQELQTFCRSFSKMKITPQQVAKVTKERIYSVAIHPSREKVLVCAGDKSGSLGMWDVVSSMEYDEKPPQPKFGGNRIMGARHMAA